MYFYAIDEIPTEALKKIIDDIRLATVPQIAQQSNLIFVTLKTLECIEDKKLFHKRLWIYYVILKWAMCYCNNHYTDLPQKIVRDFAQILNQYLNDNDDDSFVEKVMNLNTVVVV